MEFSWPNRGRESPDHNVHLLRLQLKRYEGVRRRLKPDMMSNYITGAPKVPCSTPQYGTVVKVGGFENLASNVRQIIPGVKE